MNTHETITMRVEAIERDQDQTKALALERALMGTEYVEFLPRLRKIIFGALYSNMKFSAPKSLYRQLVDWIKCSDNTDLEPHWRLDGSEFVHEFGARFDATEVLANVCKGDSHVCVTVQACGSIHFKHSWLPHHWIA